MATIKKMTIEYFGEFTLGKVELTNNTHITVVGTVNDDYDMEWKAEASDRNEDMEIFAREVVSACYMQTIECITRD